MATEFKTLAEITSANELIQYLEQLRSGSLGTLLGINRPLERLGTNIDVLRKALQQSWAPARLTGGGTVSFSAGTLTWSSAITVRVFDQDTGIIANTVNASSLGLSSGDIVYCVVNRGSSATITLQKTALATFLSTVGGSTARMDYVPVAYYDGTYVHFINGKGLRTGTSFSNGFTTESQYGQQSELTTVHENQKDNLNLRLTGGGDITWDADTNTLSWTDDFIIEYPAVNGYNYIAGPDSVVIDTDYAWYATLSRDPSGAVSVSTSTATTAGGVPDTDDAYVIAINRSLDDRVYLADGSAISDGETIKLGGVRIGVQFFIQTAGSGAQVTDVAGLSSPSVSYRVGSGELMVYRNGVKAVRSRAYWEGGAYPTGSLNTTGGAIRANDDYLEEDAGDGTGTRIIWLADGQAVAEPVYNAVGTHDPALEWPSSTDILEIFIGNQGQAPTVTIPDGVYGFDSIWTQTTTTVRTGGGTLVASGQKYPNLTGAPLSMSTTDMFGTDTLQPSTWHYIYIGPGASPGASPVLKLSTTPPEIASPSEVGAHPDNPYYKFLSSIRVSASSVFRPLTKAGGEVFLSERVSLLSAFSAGLITGSFQTVDLSSLLPETGVRRVRLRVLITSLVGVAAGSRLLLSTRVPGFSANPLQFYSIKPSNSNDVEYIWDQVLSPTGTFQINLSSSDFNSFAVAEIQSYSEGVRSAGKDLGS